MDRGLEYINARWPAPSHVHALTTTRAGGCSKGIYKSFNLAAHVEDNPADVQANRSLLKSHLGLPSDPVWLAQVHSNRVIEAGSPENIEADASWTLERGIVCTVLTADCLPVFFSNTKGDCVAVAHAGWRGLLNGVISATFSAMNIDAGDCLVWLGPAIGPETFEVGKEVFDAFTEKNQANAPAFQQTDEKHWLCDMYELARIELKDLGINNVFGENLCTFTDEERFYSFRRDGQTGRMASLIWIGD